MAIIKGVKAADVSTVTPYKDNIDSLSKGIMALDARATDNRNMIAESRAAMLKQTRDHGEDVELAQQLETGFKRDADDLVTQAGMDYSMIGKDQLQSLAIDYAGKTEFRVLSEAYRNQNEYTKLLQNIDTTHGPAVELGEYNPVKDGLKNEDGTYRNFTNRWKLEKRLNHSQAAKSLYDEIGHTMTEYMKTQPGITIKDLPKRRTASGVLVDDWQAFMKDTTKFNKDNIQQVDKIIQGALNSFIEGPEGKQYYEINYENALYGRNGVTKMSEEEARKYAREKAQDLIFTYGESEKYTELKKHEKETPFARANNEGPVPDRPTGNRSTKSSGDGESGVLAPIPSTTATSPTSSHAFPDNTKSVFTTFNESTTSKFSLSELAKETDKNEGALSYSNPNMTAASALMVSNSDPDPNSTTPSAMGYIQRLELGDPINNRSTVHIKYATGPAAQNTTASNYGGSNSTYRMENGMLIIPVTKDGVTTNAKHTVQSLVSELGDDLFHLDDFRAIQGKLTTGDMGVNLIKEKSANNASVSLSAYSIDPTTGDISNSEVLTRLQEYYTEQLEKNTDPRVKMLFEAKLQKINEKIEGADEFRKSNESSFAVLTNKILINNEHNRLTKDNIYLAGTAAGVSREVVDIMISEGGTLDEKYKPLMKKAEEEAYKKIGLGIGDLSLHGRKHEKNDEFLELTKQLFERERQRLIGGEYSEDDLGYGVTATKGYYPETEYFKIAHQSPPTEYSKWLTAGTYLRNMYAALLGGMEKTVDANGMVTPTRIAEHGKFYQDALKEAFKTNGNMVKFIDNVEQLNDMIDRTGTSLYWASAGNSEATGWAENSWEKKTIPASRGAVSHSTPWRNPAFEIGTEKDEQINKDELLKKLKTFYKESTGKDPESTNYQEWENKLLDDSYKGIRMDLDNKGSLFVAHYEIALPGGGRMPMEHDVTLGRDAAVQFFGIPSVYYTLGDEMRSSLQENKAMYADFDGWNGESGVRLHQNIGVTLHGGDEVKRGEYYLLYSANYDNPQDDPLLGSKQYHPADPNIKRKKFAHYDQFFSFIQKSQSDNGVLPTLTKVTNQYQLLGKVDPSYIFPPDSPFIKNGMTVDQIKKELEEVIKRLTSGETKYNASTTVNEFIKSGDVNQSKNGAGEVVYNIKPDVLSNMDLDKQKNIALAIKSDFKNIDWKKGDDGHHYPIDYNSLIPLDKTSLTNFSIGEGVKVALDPSMAGFLNTIQSLVVNLKAGKVPSGYNAEDFKTLDLTEPITITSGLRSLQDNMRAYNVGGNGNLNTMVNSAHMRGKSLDIRTEPGNPNYKAGKALWEFFKTPSGVKYLKENNLSAFYHKVSGGTYHIDLSTATNSRPAGKVWDDKGNRWDNK